MGLRIYSVNFADLISRESIRLWVPFALPELSYKYDKLNNFLTTCESGSRPKGGIKDEDYDEAVSLGGEQIGMDGNLDLAKIPYVSFEFYENSSKGKVIDQDILICKDGALTGKTCFVDKSLFASKKVMVNEHIFILRGNSNINQKFLFYYTRTDIFQNQVKDLAYKKKAQPGLNTEHFKKLKFPLIPKPKQDQIVTQIETIENKIKELKSHLIPQQEIINKVFSKKFNYDENLFNEFGKGMTAGTQIAKNKTLRVFETNFNELSKSGILRFSTRYHNPPTKSLMNFLESIETMQVKDILLESVHRGTSPKYNSEGIIPVVKTGHLKNEYIEVSNEEFVDYDTFNATPRAQVKQGDILIASTGKVSLGKIDLLEEEQDLFADGHVSIIRIDDAKYSHQFFIYYFRSVIGYFQIERDFTGATNQIELYSDEISNFQIPNIPLTSQQKIVDEIKDELNKQEEIKKRIETERNKIDNIIENSLK